MDVLVRVAEGTSACDTSLVPEGSPQLSALVAVNPQDF